ncbi:MAG: Dam family site-specific DNA-(adenine-N6)-methyltransferase [Nitrososphaerales archaeon]|jgi:DNA adenine methylase
MLREDSPLPSPFVKWAGGKGQLLAEFDRYLPSKFASYHEPFLGGGAFFFHLYNQALIRKAVISDSNPDIVNAFFVVRDSLDQLLTLLENLQRYAKDENYFYDVARPRFNSIRLKTGEQGNVEKAALLLYLNKTCFNGLYRVNKKGDFNVPWGRYTNPRICDAPNLKAVSRVLKDKEVRVACRDFSKVKEDAQKGDFIYFDPPYSPLSPTANFAEYTSQSFVTADQVHLAELYHELASRGCFVMLSNSLQVSNLYEGQGYRLEKVKATRAINSVAAKRGAIEELLVMNY